MNREGLQDEWILLFNYIKFTVQNIYAKNEDDDDLTQPIENRIVFFDVLFVRFTLSAY